MKQYSIAISDHALFFYIYTCYDKISFILIKFF